MLKMPGQTSRVVFADHFICAAAVFGETALLLRGTQLFIGSTTLNVDIRGGNVMNVGAGIASSE